MLTGAAEEIILYELNVTKMRGDEKEREPESPVSAEFSQS